MAEAAGVPPPQPPPPGAPPPAAGAAAAAAAAPPVPGPPGGLQFVETDMSSHLWFETPRFAGRSPTLSPQTTDLKYWLSYWNGRRHALGAQRAIEKACHYIAPASRVLFDEATAMSRFRHNRNDWDLFANTIKKVFQIAKSDVASHPLRDMDWMLRIPMNIRNPTPRNLALRIYLSTVQKPLKHFSSMVFDPNARLRHATYASTRDWLNEVGLLPDDAPAIPNNLLPAHRTLILVGAALALQFQAFNSFKFGYLPAQMADPFADILEDKIKMDNACTANVMDQVVEDLVTYLTTQHNTQGPSTIDKMKVTVAALSTEDQQQPAAVSAITNKNKKKPPRKNDSSNQSQTAPGSTPTTTPGQNRRPYFGPRGRGRQRGQGRPRDARPSQVAAVSSSSQPEDASTPTTSTKDTNSSEKTTDNTNNTDLPSYYDALWK